MSRVGTHDFIEDAIQALDRDGCVYVLLVGRHGERVTRIYGRNRGNVDLDTVEHIRRVLDEYLVQLWTQPDPPEAPDLPTYDLPDGA